MYCGLMHSSLDATGLWNSLMGHRLSTVPPVYFCDLGWFIVNRQFLAFLCFCGNFAMSAVQGELCLYR